MTQLPKIRLKRIFFTLAIVAVGIAITWKAEALHITSKGIYTNLTDTIPLRRSDSSAITDSTPTQKIDTFNLKISKDTLNAPVDYEAADSAVLLVKENRFFLYGKTKTVYKDVTLNAPKIEFNQQTNILTAFNSKDSLGNVITRAQFQQGSQGFQSDTIEFNFKTQKGLTRNTYTKQDQMFVQANVIKKVDSNTTFAKRVIMTTCDYDEPHFGFVGNKAKFINGKVAVTGPIHPEFEGVPIPIYLPFGIFPLQNGRHSGLLPPTFADNEQYGIGLEGLGYYHVLNEYLDMTLHGNLYSYGGWSGNLTTSYRKLYRYTGSMNLSVQHTKINFKGDPDFSVTNTYFVTWSHSVDPKARPGTIFSASVNAGSTKYNQYVANNAMRPFENNLASSISYSKSWADKPYNLTLSANESQNSNNHLINLTLPDAGFTVSTIYPLQPKEPVGPPKWYEKLGVGYTGIARNQASFYDTAHTGISKLFDTLQVGAQHRLPISLSLPPIGPLLFSPFVSYEETWYSHEYGYRWDTAKHDIDTINSKKGFFTDRQVSFGIGLNTAIYGTYQFKHSRLIALRHVIRPTFSFNYKPNLSAGNYDLIMDDRGVVHPYSHFLGNIFSPYPYGKFGGISFGVDNNLEMKWRSKKDTGAAAIKKIRLIDGFGFTSGYNFLSDSLKLLPFNLYLRSTLFEKINITAQALLDPYQQGASGQDINKYLFQGGGFHLGRINSGSVAISTSFKSKPRDENKQPNPVSTRQITDPA
ncbi:MAG: putative LPS assembly protein LptD, partial [Flavisolibacter sp.]